MDKEDQEEEEFDLNFIKIDYTNKFKLIENVDLELEMIDLFASVSPFQNESIDGILLKFFKKFIPSSKDLVSTDSDLIKKFIKEDKKGLDIVESVNRILSTNFQEKFIFNKTNLTDVCNIIAKKFSSIKKKLSNLEEFQEYIKKINFKKYDIDKMYMINDVENRNNLKYNQKNPLDRKSLSQLDEIYEDVDNGEENKCINKYFNKSLGMTYIDNNPRNIMNSSKITQDFNYNEEETSKKLLTKDCFTFQPSKEKEEGELPIEIIILLYKFKDVKTLIYQINNVDEQFFNMAIFLFLNMNWLFSSEIEEIKIDLGNEELQKRINYTFNKRALELYDFYHKSKNMFYFDRNYQARTINCWDPESDIIFLDSSKKETNSYIYSEQENKEECNFDNHFCNIYDEYGLLTNFKYIRPVAYTLKRDINVYEQNDLIDEIDTSIDAFKKIERDTISLNNSSFVTSKSFDLGNMVNLPVAEKPTTVLMKEFIKNYFYYFQMITIYSYFFWNNFKNLKKLNLYFNTSYSYEIQLMLKYFDINYDRFHFLIFTKDIDTLTEASFSFNSLDSKSFENILAIIDRNYHLTSLKMSFFTPDINYFDDGLFNLWSSKKLNLKKLFKEQREFTIANSGDKERNMYYFILHHNKLLESLAKNIRNFFNLLKTKLLFNLEELILRFDIPLTLLNSDKYIILLVKFLINIIIMLTFQENHIHTLKILAPELPINSMKTPYLRQLFKEIILEGDLYNEENEEKLKSDQKKKEKQRTQEHDKFMKELKIKANEMKEKKERKEFLQKISNPGEVSKFSSKDVQKGKGKEEFDINEQNKRFKSLRNKNTYKGNEQDIIQNDNENAKPNQRTLYKNISLENITLQLKINNMPEIFNIFVMNNLKGLKSINLGYLDEVTFISFLEDYKLNANKLVSLQSLKISLCPSVISYTTMENHISDFVNTNTPNLQEKYLFSDLKIVYEAKMNDLVQLVYFKSKVPKLVVQIGNCNDNIHLLQKTIGKYIKDKRTGMNSFILLMDIPKYKPLYTMNIIKCLASFYSKNPDKAILCKEDPNKFN